MGFTPKPVGPMSEDRKQLHTSLESIAKKKLLDPNIRLMQAKQHGRKDHEFLMANERLKRALTSKENIKRELDDFENVYRGGEDALSSRFSRSYDAYKDHQDHHDIYEQIERIRLAEGHHDH